MEINEPKTLTYAKDVKYNFVCPYESNVWSRSHFSSSSIEGVCSKGVVIFSSVYASKLRLVDHCLYILRSLSYFDSIDSKSIRPKDDSVYDEDRFRR